MSEWVWWNKTDGGVAVGPRDKGCQAIVFTVEEAQAICRAVNQRMLELAEARSVFAILCRAVGNWREWPGEAATDHDHPDWLAAARAILERDELKAMFKKVTGYKPEEYVAMRQEIASEHNAKKD